MGKVIVCMICDGLGCFECNFGGFLVFVDGKNITTDDMLLPLLEGGDKNDRFKQNQQGG